MTVPDDRKSLNIRRSFCRFFEEQFAIPNSMKGKVSYEDSAFDATDKETWLAVNFLSDMAGKKGTTLVQIDVLTRYAGRRTGGDRYGTICQQYADKVHAALHVDAVPIYDFGTNPRAPALIAGKKLVIQNNSGIFREPDEVRAMEFEEGINRIIFTYRIKVLGDYAKAPSYYD